MAKPRKKSKKGAQNPLLSVGLRWLQLLIGLALGWYAANHLYGKTPAYEKGVPAFLLAAFFLLRFFPAQVKALSFKITDKIQPRPEGSMDPLWVNIGVVVILVSGQWCFWKGWVLAACLLTLLLAGGIAWIQWGWGFSAASPSRFSLPEKKMLWVILLLVAILDFSQISHSATGLCLDEANNLQDAAGVAQGYNIGPFTTGWGGTPTLPDFIVGGAFKLFGIHLWAARVVSILASLIALWFFFHWCRFYFGPLPSLVATFLMGSCWWFLYFSLSVWHTPLLFMAITMTYYFLEKGFRDGRKMDFWWAGLCAAGCVMNYVPGRSMPLVLLGTVLGYGFIQGSSYWRTYWKFFVLALLGFLLFTGPFLLWAFNNGGEVWGRVQAGWIGETAKITGSYLFLIPIYFWSLISFWTPNPHLEFRFAYTTNFVDPVSAGLFLLGLMLCLVNWKKRISWVILPGVFWGISANALGIQYVTPPSDYWHAFRSVVAVPFLFLGAAAGVDWLVRFHETYISNRKLGWLVPVFGVFLLLSLYLNIPVILGYNLNDRANWSNLGYAQIKESDVLNECSPQNHLLVRGDIISSIVYFQTLGKANFKVIGDPSIPLPYKVSKDLMIFFANSDSAKESIGKIKKTYPNGVWKEYPTPFGGDYMISVTIPKADVESAAKSLKNLETLN